MKNKYLFIFFTIIVAAIIILGGLYLFAEKPNLIKNGFSRKFITNPIQLINVANYKTHVTGISGCTANGFYFNNDSANELIVSDSTLNKVSTIKLGFNVGKIGNSFYTLVDSNNAYINAYNLPEIIRYNLKSKNKTVYFLKRAFGRSINISSNSFILRSLDPGKSDEVFKKVLLSDSVKEKLSESVIGTIGDGGLSMDGFLYYDSTTKLLCYTFFYQNGFVCMDTNLNMVYKASTIDTNYTPKIIGHRFPNHSNTSYTLAAPPKFISMQGCVFNGHLFLRSGLKADNEKFDKFQNNSVIDIYNLKTGNYQGSFYLPNYENKKLSQFGIFINVLIATYDNYIVAYKLRY